MINVPETPASYISLTTPFAAEDFVGKSLEAIGIVQVEAVPVVQVLHGEEQLDTRVDSARDTHGLLLLRVEAAREHAVLFLACLHMRRLVGYTDSKAAGLMGVLTSSIMTRASSLEGHLSPLP